MLTSCPLSVGRQWSRAAVFAAGGLWLLWLMTQPPRVCGESWLDDSQADFAAGKLDAAGQNLYVSREGTLRAIHRFDLNQDGFLDLIFNSTHDSHSALPATTVAGGGQQPWMVGTMGADGSQQCAIADFNRDGYLDVAFCPNAGGVQHGRRWIAICWGGPDGWPASRCNAVLPVHRATRIAVADPNADGHPDLVTLNGKAWLPEQPAGEIVRIYWNLGGYFQLARFADRSVPGAVDLAAGDLDSDGHAEFAVLAANTLEIHWSRPGSTDQAPATGDAVTRIGLPDGKYSCLAVGKLGGSPSQQLVVGGDSAELAVLTAAGERRAAAADWKVARVPAMSASQLTLGDLDRDGRQDLVLTRFSTARAAGGEAAGAGQLTGDRIGILWGVEAGIAGESIQFLPVELATGTAVGDLDRDGYPDLLVSVYQGAQALRGDSLIFFGRGTRQFERGAQPIPTSGATSVAFLPAHREHPPQGIFCNSNGGTLREAVPLQVYWGGQDGFAPDRVWQIPFRSGYESSAADLNRDGFVDFIALNSGHAGEASKNDPQLGVNIFWGAASGFDPEKSRTILHDGNLGTSNVADLDRDGYLDLILGQFSAAAPGGTAEVILWYGGPQGFLRERRATIPSPGRSISTVVADLNHDGQLDIAVNSFDRDVVRLFWGAEGKFSAERQLTLPVHSPIDLETADLNQDGRLDLIVGTYQDRIAGHHDSGSLIFWGMPGEVPFQPWNAQSLPGMTPIGHCVADFDGDGHLDLFSPHYHGNLTRELLPSYLFWGSAQGFDPRRRTDLICDSADDALAGDFDRDGRLDLAVVCHARDTQHSTVSQVLYNDGHRFANPRMQKLPTHGPHWMWQGDMGHIAHRRWEQTYDSRVFRWDQARRSALVETSAQLPSGATLAVEVRAAAREEQLATEPWKRVAGAPVALRATDRCLQYRLVLKSRNGDRYPDVEKVSIAVRAD